MSRVLIGTDGSTRSADAVALGATLAPLLDAEPVLVHAHPYGPLASLLAESDYERHIRGVAEEAARHAEALLDAHKPAQMRLVADDSPAAALHRAAEEEHVRAIVVGSSHRGRIGRVFPGGVAQRLLSGAPCPVAVAPAGYADRQRREIRAIGCGFDGTPQARQALIAASDLARRSAVPLRVIAVYRRVAFGHIPIAAGRPEISANERLKSDLEGTIERALEAAGLADDAVAVLREGDPGTELVAESQTLDLLVLGSRGYGPIGAVLLGSVAAMLLHDSACPVVVVPRGARRTGTRPDAALTELADASAEEVVEREQD